jgi:PAS domain S-box-containing protein
MNTRSKKTDYRVIFISSIPGLIVWILDAALDYVYFYKGRGSFLGLLILHVPVHEIYIRSVILGFFILFGVFISRKIAKLEEAEDGLQKAKDKLELRVTERTEELKDAVRQLEFELQERRKAEEALQLERNKLKSILDTMQDGVYIVNQEHDIQYINPVIEKEFGPINGRKCHEYLNANEEVCSRCTNQEIFSGKSVRWEWHSSKTGKTYDLSDTPILDMDGTISKLEVFHDITERKQMEDALKTSEKQLRYLSSQLLTAQESERKRISRELHDGLGGGLAILKLRVNFIKKNLQEDQTGLRAECEEDARLIDRIMEDVQRLSRDMSPSIVEDLGLSAALQWLTGIFTRNYKINATFDHDGVDIDHRFSRQDQVNIYRIFQEVFTNIGKHSHAKNVTVAVEKHEDRASFLIRDDGKGFDLKQVLRKDLFRKGLGLATMAERARMLGGFLDLRSQEGKGTQVTISVPLKAGEEGSL